EKRQVGRRTRRRAISAIPTRGGGRLASCFDCLHEWLRRRGARSESGHRFPRRRGPTPEHPRRVPRASMTTLFGGEQIRACGSLRETTTVNPPPGRYHLTVTVGGWASASAFASSTVMGTTAEP